MATLGFPLRFNTVKQKENIKKIAKKNNRSLNAEILHMVDMKILESSSIGTSNDKIK
jgi:hypothetical protein